MICIIAHAEKIESFSSKKVREFVMSPLTEHWKNLLRTNYFKKVYSKRNLVGFAPLHYKNSLTKKIKGQHCHSWTSGSYAEAGDLRLFVFAPGRSSKIFMKLNSPTHWIWYWSSWQLGNNPHVEGKCKPFIVTVTFFLQFSIPIILCSNHAILFVF